MKLNRATTFFLLLSLLLPGPGLYTAQVKQSKSVTSICDEFESKIKTQVDSKKYLEAIITAAEYEQTLLSRYPPATFELGLFQSETHHLSFHSLFDGWTQENLKNLKVPEWSSSTGVDILIALKGKVEEDRFILQSIDLGKIEQRIVGEELAKTGQSDRKLEFGAQMIASDLGVVKKQEFKTAGEHRLLVLEIGTLESSIVLASLAHGGRIYAFLLNSSAGNRTENEKRLYDLIKTVDFRYKPTDGAKIGAARQKITNKSDLIQVLRCIRELAIIGEYGAASEELTTLRLAIAEEMPKPLIEGNVGRYSAYGITLKNPDPEKWKLSAETKGGIGMLALEDRFSVTPAVLMVAVVNTVLAYGDHSTDLTGENASEEEKKAFLSSSGRAGFMNMKATIESERFRIFKGAFAYEGIASVNITNTKVKGIFVQKLGYFIMVLMFIDASNFSTRSAEYEALLDKYLQLEAR